MTQALVFNPNSNHFELENVSHSNGPNQAQLNNQTRLETEQLDQLVLQQLKALTQQIVDTAALQQTQSSHSSEKHDANGSHEKMGNVAQGFNGPLGVASK